MSENLVGEQVGRLHANISLQKETCCKREVIEGTNPVRGILELIASLPPCIHSGYCGA